MELGVGYIDDDEMQIAVTTSSESRLITRLIDCTVTKLKYFM